MAKEISKRTAAYCTWHYAIAKRTVRSNSGLAKSIARIQNINPSGGGEFIQVETPEWCPKGTELISQVQIKLRGGAIITNSEFAVWDNSGIHVVTRINHIHAPINLT